MTSIVKRYLKYPLIRAGLEAIASSGLSRLLPVAAGRGVIFTLHHVRPEPDLGPFRPNAVLSITPEFLEQAIRVALAEGLVPVHLHELPDLLADPQDMRKFVAFTLDDGYRDNAQWAAPIFARYQIPYTIFITSGFVNRTCSPWWEVSEAFLRKTSGFQFDFGTGEERVETQTTGQKLRAFDRLVSCIGSIDEDVAVARINKAAMAHGIDSFELLDRLVMDSAALRDLSHETFVHFGAHTESHINLKRADAARLDAEISKSTKAVEEWVGQRPQSFSYPYGWKIAVGPRETNAVLAAGFKAGVTTQPGILSRVLSSDPTGIPRVSLNGLYQKPRYVKALISGLPFAFM